MNQFTSNLRWKTNNNNTNCKSILCYLGNNVREYLNLEGRGDPSMGC